MRLAGHNLVLYRDIKKIRYRSIEWNASLIDKCTKDLESLLNDGWKISEKYQTEGGLIIELVKI